jgi:hypothetical protein
MTETPDGVPISDGFDFPVGPRGSNINVYDTHKMDAGVADPNYYRNFGEVWHPGEDWNGRSGGDTDLGQPVYAIAHGKVTWAEYNPKSWGNIVLIEHALPDGTRVWSQYAHLERIMTSLGQKVVRGQQIGTIGKGANNIYPAHLHFEIRRNNLPAWNWGPMVKNRDQVLANYFYPTQFIEAHRPGTIAQPAAPAQPPQVQPAPPPPPPQPQVPPVQVIVDSQRTDPRMGRFRRSRTDYWYSAPAGAYSSTIWTYTAPTQETNWGEWRPYLPTAGQYELSVFVPDNNATTRNARYQVVHAAGQIEVAVNQDSISNQWASLGRFNFGPGQGYLRLSDATGESQLMIAFDAARWVKVG